MTNIRIGTQASLNQNDLFDLLDKCNHILTTEKEEHRKKVFKYHKAKESSNKPQEYFDAFARNLKHAEMLCDHFTELLTRVNNHEFLITIIALQTMEKEIHKRRLTEKKPGALSGFTVLYEDNKTEILIH